MPESRSRRVQESEAKEGTRGAEEQRGKGGRTTVGGKGDKGVRVKIKD